MQIVNRTKQDKELARAFHVYIHFQKKVPIVINCILLVAFLGGLFLRSRGVLSEALFLPPMYWLFVVYIHFRRVNLMVKRLQELGRLDTVLEAVVEEDKIVFSFDGSPASHNELSFEKIKRVDQTKDYIFITTRAGIVHIFKKDGFVVGSKEEFVYFLRKNSVKVTGKL